MLQQFSDSNKFVCSSTCICNNNMRHLVIWGAPVSPDVSLFLQLRKTSRISKADMCFCVFLCVCSELPHPLLPSYFSFFYLASLSPPSPALSVSLLDLADNLAMDDFTFQEQLLTPRLATAGMGGVHSPAAPLQRTSLVPAMPATLALLLLWHHWRGHSCFISISLHRNGRWQTFRTSGSWFQFGGPSKEALTTKKTQLSS